MFYTKINAMHFSVSIMYINTLLILLGILILSTSTLEAENYYFRHYEKKDGLSHQTVYCAIQDKRDFMWFGTKAGLNRFDGTNFKIYVSDHNDPSSLPNNTVLSIIESPSGLFWIGTNTGLCSFDPKTEIFESFPEIKGAINNITFDKQGNLWVINMDGIYCIDVESGQCHFNYKSEQFVPTGIHVTTNGSVWILGSDGNLYRYNTKGMNLTSYSILTEDEKNQHVMMFKILECSNGDLLLTTDKIGVKRFSPNRGYVESLFSEDVGNSSIYIHTAIQNDKDEFWFGTESGIHIYKIGIGFTKHLQKSFHNEYSLSDDAIHMLYKDREDGVWAGTFFGGLNYLEKNNNSFEKYFPKDDKGLLKANVIRELQPDYKGNLWVGTEDGGLCYFNTQTKKFHSLSNLSWKGQKITRNIQCLFIDENLLWIGTFDSGIYQLDLKTEKIVNHFCRENTGSGLEVNGIVCIDKTTHNDILIGTLGGLYRLKKPTNEFELIPDLNWGLVHSIYEDKDNIIWIATMGRGLFTLKYDNDEPLIKSIPFITNYITTIFEDSQNQLWIGTEGDGIFLLDRKTGICKQALPEQEYLGLIIYRIIEDSQKRLWISTSKGLLSYNLIDRTLNQYTTQNGLPIDQFNYNSGYQDRVGTIYFGSLKGMVSFSPENIYNSVKKIKVYFTGIQVFSEEVEVSQPKSPLKNSIIFTNEVRLSHDQSTISIDFASPSYTSQNIWYRCKLEGADSDWVTLQEAKRLYYTKLPPGKYTLFVEASRNRNEWVGEFSSLNITIRSPLWKTTFAYFIYFAFLSSLLAYLVVFFKKKNREKERIQLIKIQDIKQKEILQAKISFFTNITHEIRTPLTLIMGSLNRLNNELLNDKNITILKKNTHRLLDLVNQLLDFRKIESSFFIMNFSNVDIKQLIDETFTRFTPLANSKEIEYSIILPTECHKVLADKDALIKILSNMFNNAIKFSDKIVQVILEYELNEVHSIIRIRVNNDGELIPEKISNDIFKPFYHYSNKNNVYVNGTGLGLPMTKSLAEMHNGSFYLDKTITNFNSFVFEMPIELPNSNGTNIDISTEEEENEFDYEQATLHNNFQTILVVDDEIEMRQFLQEELSPTYNVYTAHNGMRAIEILDNHNINLIVSDWMMPVMDGLELCESIKSNIKYSHIPFVVLTAKVSLQSHINVLKSKADAYIEKPFSSDHLLAQISNLLTNREIIRSTFVNSPYAHLASVVHNDIDEKFVEKVNDLIFNNIGDANLSVESLAEFMNMSTSTLYRKVKAITSLSPNDLIRLCKLKKAAELLAKQELRVSEVAEMVGYSSTSYFTSCFMKQFGMTPSEFLNNKKV